MASKLLIAMILIAITSGCASIVHGDLPEEAIAKYKGTPFGAFVELSGDYEGRQYIILKQILESSNQLKNEHNLINIFSLSLEENLQLLAFQATLLLVEKEHSICRTQLNNALLLIEMKQIKRAKAKLNYLVNVCSYDNLASNKATKVLLPLEMEGEYSVQKDDYILNL